MSESSNTKTSAPVGRGPRMGRSGRGSHGPGGPGHGMPFEKAKDFKISIKRLVSYLQKHKIALVVVTLMAIGGAVFSIFGPKILGTATTELFAPMAAKAEAMTELKEILPEEAVGQITSGKLSEREVMSIVMQSVDTTDPHQMFVLSSAMEKAKAADAQRIDFGKIGGILLTVLILYAVSGLFTFIMQFVMAKTSQLIVFDMRNQVDAKLARLPLKYFDGRTHGEILSRVTNDIDTISTTLSQGLTQVISSVTMIIGIIIMMFTISWIITLVCLIVLPISFFFIQLIVKKSQKYFKEQQKEIGNINGHVEEMYAGHTVIKAFGREDDSVKAFDKVNNRLYSVGWKAQFLSGAMMPLIDFISNLSYVFVCAIGGVMVISGSISIGDVQAFIQYSRRFTHPIMQVAQIANVLQSTVAAAERVFEVLDEQEISADRQDNIIEYPKGAITFEHVSFGYVPGVPVIKDMNLTVSPGETVAIVGPTGAGKTTLVNLLMRFYEIDSGRITVDGTDITTIPRENLRRQFGMVLQDTWLFGGTIRENIAYGKTGATEEEIIYAAKMADADYFIRTLPDGYDTVLNEEASNISQGQKQLLTIARALLADPPVLILDEATSNVDTRTEAYIQNAMIELMKGRTNFVIAHRLSTIRDASTILVMNEGEIIEQGNHKALMAKNGFYADLYNSQFTQSSAI
ncbi:MAG: ABC transporter ATP-binding protein [Christensenellales bacterium]|jgi:ATP-binding cassette subfamily B multidrug efflux pump